MVEVPLLPNDLALLDVVDARGVEVHLNAAGSSANLPDEAGDDRRRSRAVPTDRTL
jgi:hypothetical protein